MNKKIKVLIIFAAIFSVLIGGTVVFVSLFVFGKLSNDKVITEGNLSMSIPAIFSKQTPTTDLDWFYLNSAEAIGICGKSDSVSELKREYRLEIDNLDEYINLWMESGRYSKLHMYGPYDAGTYKYLEFQSETDGEYFSYYAAAFQHDDRYYMITFYCPSNKYALYKSDFNTWAESITFE